MSVTSCLLPIAAAVINYYSIDYLYSAALHDTHTRDIECYIIDSTGGGPVLCLIAKLKIIGKAFYSSRLLPISAVVISMCYYIKLSSFYP